MILADNDLSFRMSLIATVVCFFVFAYDIENFFRSRISSACKLGSNAVSCIPRPLLSPRVLLHRLVSASRVPSRFRYSRSRRAYVCSRPADGRAHICTDSALARAVGGTRTSHKEEYREKERAGWLARGKLARWR